MIIRGFAAMGCLLVLGGLASGQQPQQPGAAGKSVESPSALFEKLDKNRDGVLISGEIPESQARFFDRLVRIGDSNKDGKLTRAEFTEALSGDSNPTARPENRPGAEGNRRGRRPGTTDNPEADRQRRGQFFDRLDSNKDGKLTKEEMPERSQQLFDFLARRLNKRPGEAITRGEFLEAMSQRPGGQRPTSGNRPGGGRSPAFLRLLDTNRDGRLSREELSKAADRFDQLDRNGDGQLDIGELFGGPRTQRPGQPGRPQRPGRPDATPQRPGTRPANSTGGLFARLDKDGNGKIEGAEVPRFLKNRLKQFDTNGDGAISVEEYRKGSRARR